jgi:hypothetical protein
MRDGGMILPKVSEVLIVEERTKKSQARNGPTPVDLKKPLNL